MSPCTAVQLGTLVLISVNASPNHWCKGTDEWWVKGIFLNVSLSADATKICLELLTFKRLKGPPYHISCHPTPDFHLPSLVSHLLYLVSCLTSLVFGLSSLISGVWSRVSCFSFLVSHFSSFLCGTFLWRVWKGWRVMQNGNDAGILCANTLLWLVHKTTICGDAWRINKITKRAQLWQTETLRGSSRSLHNWRNRGLWDSPFPAYGAAGGLHLEAVRGLYSTGDSTNRRSRTWPVQKTVAIKLTRTALSQVEQSPGQRLCHWGYLWIPNSCQILSEDCGRRSNFCPNRGSNPRHQKLLWGLEHSTVVALI